MNKAKNYYNLFKVFERKYKSTDDEEWKEKYYKDFRATLRYIMHTDLYSYPLHNEIVKRAKRLREVYLWK